MKCIIRSQFLLALILPLALSINLSASTASGKNSMSLTTNPATLIFGTIPLTFRFGVSDKVAIGISGHGRFFSIGSDLTTYGGGGGLDMKINISGTSFTDGWYAKPAVNFGYSAYKMSDIKDGTFFLQPNLIFGHDWVWESGFTLGLGFGVAYTHNFKDMSKFFERAGGLNLNGFLPTGEFTVGFVF